MSLAVVKVGGSLYDLPDLGDRLRRWLPTLEAPRILLVPGGGQAADLVRDFTRRHGLSEEEAHWLALRAVGMNAHFLAALLPGTPIVHDPAACEGGLAVLDAFAFARADEARPDPLPHTWSVTSDSLAARVARIAAAGWLILLKSVTIPPETPWHDAARRGWVDPTFPEVVPLEMAVSAVNFRTVKG